MLNYKIEPYELQFLKPAKTSRNVFETRKIYLVKLTDTTSNITGTGESAPLSLLSIDDVPDYEKHLDHFVASFCAEPNFSKHDFSLFPSILFGLETAYLDLSGGGKSILYKNEFTAGNRKIPINGLVWMNDVTSMYTEALAKINQGYKCIKFKVGAQDFDTECRMLEKIRKKFSAYQLEIRLDANGAFHHHEARSQLKDLKRFEIHSIEQPIKPKQHDELAKLCSEAIIDIALDEELIGIDVLTQASGLLNLIRPQYIILKPNLLGGLTKADQWIREARKLEIDWWATSALESNIGLNAIAQWVANYAFKNYQGLGTGSLYANNFDVNLLLKNGEMAFES